MRSSKQLAWQQGNRGIFAEIVLDIESGDQQQAEIMIPDSIASHWIDAIRFGARLFVESHAWQHPTWGKIAVVNSIKAVPGDTTICSLAYVTFQAFCSAYSVSGEHVFSFDPIAGSFSIRSPSV